MSKRISFSVESATGGFIIETVHEYESVDASGASYNAFESARSVVTTQSKVVKALKEVLSKLDVEAVSEASE